MSKKKYFLIIALVVLSLFFAGCSSQNSGSQEGSDIQQETELQGPMADENRKPEALQILQGENETQIIKADLGNVKENKYISPSRGIIVTPKEIKDSTPLIVVNHLRSPNCEDGVFAYPCAEGKKEYRYDEGMTYLGEKLASQGYTVLIPDLAPAWIGSDIANPYNQDKMWQKIIGDFVKNIKANMSGKTNAFGKEKILNVDLKQIGLVLHSRSANLVEPALKLFGENNVKSVFAYGPSYETIDEEYFSPAPEDIPYLALTSIDDQDVSISANLWLSNYATLERKTPAIVATATGLGHNYINRALSENNMDDRIGCEEKKCFTAQEHEEIMYGLSKKWFDNTIKGEENELPVNIFDELPDNIEAIPVTWFATTHGKNITKIPSKDFLSTDKDTGKVCRHADPMSPEKPKNTCPEPEIGVIHTSTLVNHLTDVKIKTEIKNSTLMAINILPFGSIANKVEGTPVTVELKLSNGSSWIKELDSSNPALKNKQTDIDNGQYFLNTIRIKLPKEVKDETIEEIRIKSSNPVEISSIDIVH